jgi:hypothetical protein
MITNIAQAWNPAVKRISFGLLLLLIVVQTRLSAQETAAGGQAAPSGPVPTNQPSGLLTPPPDNAPAVAPAPPAAAPLATTPASAPPSQTAPSTSTKMTPREIARVQQQEIIRRQELIFRANESLKTARKAELATEYPEARKDYLFSAEAFGSISRSTDSYATAAEGLTRVDFQLYDDALKIGDTARAKRLMDEVIEYNPNNQVAKEK